MEYKESIANIAEIIGGGTPKTSISEYWNGNIPWISIADFNNDNKVIYKTEKTITELGLKNSSTKLLRKGDIIISARGTVGEIGILGKEMAFNQSCYGLRAKEDIVRNEYLYYALKNSVNYIKSNTHGSVFDTITKETFNNIKIDLISLDKQDKLVKILGCVDKKIELNNHIKYNLQRLMTCLYEENYINKENIEYRKLAEFMPVITGKKDAKIATEKGKYPFFTCSQNISYTDDYSFDSDSILLAGNGDFNVKFCRGKFEAYQRTYVLTPINKENLGFLYQSIKYNLNKITSGYRGSVIKFITKANIEDCKIPYIDDKELISRFNRILFSIENLDKENEKLKRLRDTLLPNLMNGEIDLDKIKI